MWRDGHTSQVRGSKQVSAYMERIIIGSHPQGGGLKLNHQPVSAAQLVLFPGERVD